MASTYEARPTLEEQRPPAARRQMVRQPFAPSGEMRILPYVGSLSLGGGDGDVQRLRQWSYRLPTPCAHARATRSFWRELVLSDSWPRT